MLSALALLLNQPLVYLVWGVAVLMVAGLAMWRGRSWAVWAGAAMVLTPVLAVLWLWFLRDLAYEQRRLQESLAEMKQRRHRREPDDSFHRARKRQEQEIHSRVITTRTQRRRAAEQPVAAPRILRARENRTPITAIMESWELTRPFPLNRPL